MAIAIAEAVSVAGGEARGEAKGGAGAEEQDGAVTQGSAHVEGSGACSATARGESRTKRRLNGILLGAAHSPDEKHAPSTCH